MARKVSFLDDDWEPSGTAIVAAKPKTDDEYLKPDPPEPRYVVENWSNEFPGQRLFMRHINYTPMTADDVENSVVLETFGGVVLRRLMVEDEFFLGMSSFVTTQGLWVLQVQLTDGDARFRIYGVDPEGNATFVQMAPFQDMSMVYDPRGDGKIFVRTDNARHYVQFYFDGGVRTLERKPPHYVGRGENMKPLFVRPTTVPEINGAYLIQYDQGGAYVNAKYHGFSVLPVFSEVTLQMLTEDQKNTMRGLFQLAKLTQQRNNRRLAIRTGPIQVVLSGSLAEYLMNFVYRSYLSENMSE